MSNTVQFHGRVHPEFAAVAFKHQVVISSKDSLIDQTIWSLWAHNSQVLIRATFPHNVMPPEETQHDIARGLASLYANWIGFSATRVYDVEITMKTNEVGDAICYGADIPGVTPKNSWVPTEVGTLEKMHPRALTILMDALDDFKRALSNPSKSPMFVHRILEAFAWYFVADETKRQLEASDWITFWSALSLTDSEISRWSKDVLFSLATKVRHGRQSDGVREHFPTNLANIRTVINCYVEVTSQQSSSDQTVS